MNTMTLNIGDWVAIIGKPGIYKVKGWNKDGSVGLYGGDPMPKGRRGFRAVMPELLRPSKPPREYDNDAVPTPVMKRRMKRGRR